MSSGSLRDLKDNASVPHGKRKHNSEGDVVEYGESQWLQSQDQTDAIPDTLRFNWFDILCILFSMLTYVADLGMDIYVAYVYYATEYIGYFILTLIFVIIPSVTMTAFSLRWYVIDMDNQTIPKPSCCKWVIRTVFLLLQIAPVLRYFDALAYGLKSKRAAKMNDRPNQYKYYAYMINEDADSTLLRLFEAFMESAPQVTLQLYILIYHFNDPKGPFVDRSYIFQILTVMSSLVSLAWSLSAYHRSLRYAQQDKTNISYKGTLLQFCWHMCSISARVFALGVFAATYPLLIIPVCIAHWLAMLAWLIVQGTQSTDNQCEEALFNLVVAFIYIFTFFNVRDEPTRYKYLTFYVINFLENSVLLFTWFFSFNLSTQEILWFRISGLVGDYALFFVGILCMVLYYVYFHPTVGAGAQKNPVNKASSSNTSIQHPHPHASEVTRDKPNKSFARKGSIDHTHLNPMNPIGISTLSTQNQSASASSSRKNVSFSTTENSSASGHQKKISSTSTTEKPVNSKSTPTSNSIPEPCELKVDDETRL